MSSDRNSRSNINNTVKKKGNSGKQPVTVKSSKGRSEIVAVILAFAAIFLILCVAGKAGLIGRIVKTLFYGLFGPITTFVCIGLLLVLAWCFARNTAGEVFTVKNCIMFGILLLLFSALIHTFNPDNTYKGMKFLDVVSSLWSNHKGSGGVIGGGVSVILQLLVARAGAIIILLPATIIMAMILFSLSMVSFFKKVWAVLCAIGRFFRKMFRRIKETKEEPATKTGKSANTNTAKKEPAYVRSSGDIEAARREIEFVSTAEKKKNSSHITDVVPPPVPEEEEAPQEIAVHQKLPETDKVIPTKIPDAADEIKLVTATPDLEYRAPSFDLLESGHDESFDEEEIKEKALKTALKLEDLMRSFGVEAKVIRISTGSTVTMYELQPQTGVKVSRIKNLSDDIALGLAASGIRIEAPIPGKAAIGIEVPNDERRTVYLKELVESQQFLNHKSKLAFCLGEDISAEPVIADIAKMPHMLIAGTTGSGKSVCINCLIISLLYRCSPNDVRFIMIDPKVVELQVYNGIPHLLVPVVTEPKKAAAALAWAVQEMENRYKQFAKYNLRDINAYNAYAPDHELQPLPRIVIIIDELADLMMIVRDSIEQSINRIAQKARAAGMHLIVATQRPSVDVITGLIKANIPSRTAFAVSSQVDSKTILDYGGAEKLLGRGDMLFYPVGAMKASRVQGGFISDNEIENIVESLKTGDQYDAAVSQEIENSRIGEKGSKKASAASIDEGEEAGDDEDELFWAAVDIAIEAKQISTSYLQRKLKLGYGRASRIVDQMEERGFVSAKDGNNPRQVLITERPEV